MLKLGGDEVTAKLTDSPRYVSFSCDNSGRDDQEINSKWTIWIPVTLLSTQEDWVSEEHKIKIKTQTSRKRGDDQIGEGSLFESGLYKTTFESANFSIHSMTGEWGNSLFGDSWESGSDDVSYIWTVKITEPELEDNLLYLRLETKGLE